MLANYSWSQASNLDLSETELLQAFKKLYEETPKSQAIEKSRFLAFYIQGLIRQQQDDESSDSGGLPTEIRVALIPSVVDPTRECRIEKLQSCFHQLWCYVQNRSADSRGIV